MVQYHLFTHDHCSNIQLLGNGVHKQQQQQLNARFKLQITTNILNKTPPEKYSKIDVETIHIHEVSIRADQQVHKAPCKHTKDGSSRK